MRLKITGGRTGQMTYIANADTGERLDLVQSATIHIEAGKITTASLVVLMPDLDMEIDAVATTGKKVAGLGRQALERIRRLSRQGDKDAAKLELPVADDDSAPVNDYLAVIQNWPPLPPSLEHDYTKIEES